MCRQAQKLGGPRECADARFRKRMDSAKNRELRRALFPHLGFLYMYIFHRELSGLFNTASLLVAGAALYFPCCLPGGLLARPLRLQYCRLVCLYRPPLPAAFLSGCRDSVSLPGDLKRDQAKFFCITRCVALKRTRATSPCAGPRHDLSPRARSARTDLAEISRRVRAVIF